jgi:hypothetical protein
MIGLVVGLFVSIAYERAKQSRLSQPRRSAYRGPPRPRQDPEERGADQQDGNHADHGRASEKP